MGAYIVDLRPYIYQIIGRELSIFGEQNVEMDTAVVHFTTRDNFGEIQKTGFILPAAMLRRDPTGGDVDKISAFKEFPINEGKIVDKFKEIYADIKNSNPCITHNHLKPKDIIGLVIRNPCISVSWKDYPEENRELLSPPDITEDILEKFGTYIKTTDPIPLDCIDGTI
jgi:hypothetical protein